VGYVGTAIGSTSDLISTFYFKCTRSLTNTTNPTFPASPASPPISHTPPTLNPFFLLLHSAHSLSPSTTHPVSITPRSGTRLARTHQHPFVDSLYTRLSLIYTSLDRIRNVGSIEIHPLLNIHLNSCVSMSRFQKTPYGTIPP
jgi:hypothetical protein